MRRNQILAGIETQLERNNRLMDSVAELMDGVRLEFGRNRDQHERSVRAMAQMVDRSERSHRTMVAALNDLRDDVQAHTRAILAWLDEKNLGDK